MKKISETIIEEGININESFKTRTTVRGVILDNNNIYMLYSSLYNDYTFPGGGVKENETIEEALKRELKEELGAQKVNIIKNIGYIEELRYGIKGSSSKYLQKSYYLLCEISDIGKRTLNKREQTELSKPMFIDIDEVINHNNQVLANDVEHQEKGFKTVLKRENTVLEHIKKTILK